MIRRLQQVKNFGVFANFNWPAELPEFKRYNLIYGWNYSGKTTLSRAFRCFEKKGYHPDFKDAQVHLSTVNGANHHLSNPDTATALRVFNVDFISENLRFVDGSAEPILVLGDEDIAKQEALNAKVAEQEALGPVIAKDRQRSADISAGLENALTRYAREFIKVPLEVVNYDKRQFKPRVDASTDAPDEHLLADATLTELLRVYGSKDKKPTLKEKTANLTSLETLKTKAEVLLRRVVTAANPIPRLKNAPAVENWVRSGRPLHDGKESCQFCGQTLPDDLMSHLADHFSADYDSLMAELDGLARIIETATNEEVALDHKNEFYPALAERFVDAKVAFDAAIALRRVELSKLKERVEEKKAKAFTSLGVPSIEDLLVQITERLQTINTIIAEHNARTVAFEQKRQDAFEKIEKHYAALFVRDEKYMETLGQIGEIESAIRKSEERSRLLEGEIRTLRAEISEASKGAERINSLLEAYFGKNDISVEVSPEKRFRLVRNGIVAKNLSEGEKTAIAFAYFITRVQDGRLPLSEIRVVIDDPISSLDANHLFNTYALIKTQLSGCKQLFISTHSFEFYSLIKEWAAEDKEDFKKPQSDWKNWGIFLVQRVNATNSTLCKIPKELLNFKSEYHYLFSTLHRFNLDGVGDFDNLMGLPNMVRRFMEAFGGIMIPTHQGLKGKLPRLVPDEIQRERVWKFINHFSHNTTLTRSLSIPDLSECQAVVRICLDTVLNWDADYFSDLEAEVA